MRRTRFTLLAILLFISVLAFAQEKVDRTPKISGFVQTQYTANFNKDFELVDNTFRMRRVRMSIEGKLLENLSYKIQGDFLNSPMLVDAFLKYKFNDALSIQAGQFKVPFTIESLINPVNLEIFDYGEEITLLCGYNDVSKTGKLGRDIGIMASGSLFKVENSKGESFGIIDYQIGVFNGNGVNNIDENNSKNIAGRLDIHPMIKELTLTGSIYNGMYNHDTIRKGPRNRWSAGAQFKNKRITVRAEYIGGETGYVDYSDAENHLSKTFASTGYYAVAGYNFFLGKEKTQSLMPVVRYDYFEGTSYNNNKGTSYITAGLSYWPIKYVNCKLDYSYIQYDGGGNDHRIVAMLNFKF